MSTWTSFNSEDARGEVDAKNTFGGYNGFAGFYAERDGD